MDFIFLDTNIYHGENKKILNFFAPPFNYISMLAGYDFCKLLIPEVMEIEFLAHLKEKIKEMQKNIYFPIKIIDCFHDITNEKKLMELMLDKYEQYKKITKSVIIPMNEMKLNISDFVKMRYKKESPFTSKKDNEYQDLFIAHALIEFVSKMDENDRLHIISKDTDFRKFIQSKCSDQKLIYHNDLNEYTDDMLNVLRESKKEVIDIANDYICNMTENLEMKVNDQYEDNYIYVSKYGCSLDSIRDIVSKISGINVEMVDCDDDAIYAYVKCQVDIDIVGKIFNDDKSSYDYIEKIYTEMIFDDIKLSKTFNVCFMIELCGEYDYNSDKRRLIKIKDFNELEILAGLDFVF